ncbi:unnamed protein product [Ascophyllum nodosum]
MERLLGSLKEEHPQDGDEASVPSIDTSSSIMTIEADFLEGLTSSQSIDSTMERISATICQLSETAKALKAENEQYRMKQESFNDSSFDSGSGASSSTGQEIDEFLQELEQERLRHESTRHNLEQKAQEMQKQAAKLKYIEGVSKAVFSENRELICNIQELQDQEESGAKASVRDFEVLGAEMSRVKEALESMMHKLEEIDERAAKALIEQQGQRGNASISLFKTLMRMASCAGRILELFAFAFVVYLATSEAVLRSRGIDGYQYIH